MQQLQPWVARGGRAPRVLVLNAHRLASADLAELGSVGALAAAALAAAAETPASRNGQGEREYVRACARDLLLLHPQGLADAKARLGGARQGFCEATTDGDEGDCAAGNKGTYKLTPAEVSSWTVAAEACTRRCKRCGRCRFISLSIRFADCSWFQSCRLGSLNRGVPGFISAAVPRA